MYSVFSAIHCKQIQINVLTFMAKLNENVVSPLFYEIFRMIQIKNIILQCMNEFWLAVMCNR